MLITKTHHDVPSELDGSKHMRIYIFAPNVPNYPQAKFPGVIAFSEIYQVTGPVERFAGQIASQGFVVACPSVYHEFVGPEPLLYDDEGTGKGNDYKIQKLVAAYDEAHQGYGIVRRLAHPSAKLQWTHRCNRHVLGGTPGMPLGHATFHPKVLSSVCFFATDIHSATLGKGKKDDTLIRIRDGQLTGKEVVMIFGKQDTHVPRQGRDLIRKTLEDAGVIASFLEVQAQHAFIRDESSKGRWDAALTRSMFTFMMEVFDRTVSRDMGPRLDDGSTPEHVC